jgi:hypothetical protein
VHHSLTAYVLGGAAAMLMGLAKTGLPGVSIPAVLLMVEAFPDDAKASVGAIMPAILLSRNRRQRPVLTPQARIPDR